MKSDNKRPINILERLEGPAGPTPATTADGSLESARAPEPVWPMPVSAFLTGDYLKCADVILTRKHRDFRSVLIRWAMGGHFSHAGMIFAVPSRREGFNNTFVIEAASEGVDLANLFDYLNDRRSVVGIRRLSRPWFAPELHGLVRGRLLNSIKARYSYRTAFRAFWSVLDQVSYGLKNRWSGSKKAVNARLRQQLLPPNEFICSGLVQLGFITALGDLVQNGELEPRALADVIFDPLLAPMLDQTNWSQHKPDEQLEIVWDTVHSFSDVLAAVTPEHLAMTPKLEWIYVVRDQMVYPALSEVDAAQLLDWKPAR